LTLHVIFSTKGEGQVKIFRFDKEVGVPISAFGSQNAVISRILRSTGGIQFGCFHLGPNGVIGHHQATCPQLFLVIQGEGWVRSGDGEKVTIHAGQAAFWETGEWHESGTDSGMSAIVLESEDLHPETFMKPVD
jgi:quercetin dioxygenase-like cupin family protein